jgi:hypothetical protein
MSELRKDLPDGMPESVGRLPVDHRGYPVPWFVAWIDGKPEFRVADGGKMVRAVQENRCWVCGEKLPGTFAFVIGPMCAVNRISSEPPSHVECAHWSAQACPFLARPHMKRREGGLPENTGTSGVMLKRNPGVAMVWVTKGYIVLRPDSGGVLFEVGSPREIVCYAEGRLARQQEIDASVDSGLPLLRDIARKDGKRGLQHLEGQVVVARRLLRVA